MLSYKALIVLAVSLAASATPAVVLDVQGVESVVDLENFKVTTTLTNSGDETLRIVNDPFGPLGKYPSDIFTVTNSKGEVPEFIGAVGKFSPEIAAQQGAYITLALGETFTVEHDLGDAYDLTSTGADSYQVTPKGEFSIVNGGGRLSKLQPRIGKQHGVRVSGSLAKIRPEASISRRAVFLECNASEREVTNRAIGAAETMVKNARNYLAGLAGGSPRYVAWFGAWDTGRRFNALDRRRKIAGTGFSDFQFDCTCNDPGLYAYVFLSQFKRIYLCPVFWPAPSSTGRDSKAGVLIHESSHFTPHGQAGDYAYGHDACKNLSRNDPGLAVMNADSLEYFSENSPFIA